MSSPISCARTTAVAVLATAAFLAGTAGAATKYKVLHAFAGGTDGGGVYGGVTLDAKGKVYGTHKTIQLRRSGRNPALRNTIHPTTRKNTNESNKHKPRSPAPWQETGAISAPSSSSPASLTRTKEPLHKLTRLY